MFNFLDRIKRSTVSYIWLIHDHDVDCVSCWYRVSLNLPADTESIVQTLEFTVTYGGDEDPTKYLNPILVEMGWTGEIQNTHQGVGY